jgi:hypothetical protein
MDGKRILLIIVGAIATVFPANQSAACTVFWTPFHEELRDAEWAVRATPEIEFTTYADQRWTGTLQLRKVRCLKKPSRYGCPTSIVVHFDDVHDGASCPSRIEGIRPGLKSKVKYFLLRRDDNSGEWRLNGAHERYW